ncbi:JmjC domain-containing protein [Chondromyces crocatus]|uniref:JmjC domain-containing protein n=1 Tax=Chondromyces crocatus TaxID=52 RepID=UPI00067BC18B|nr:cupin domain-containing protein [Chondromyces crocatus]
MERLIRPASLDDFREGDAWRYPQLDRGPLTRFPELLAIPELFDLSRLAAVYNEPVPVWMPARWLKSAAHRGLYGTFFEPESALRLHRLGATLFFPNVERFLPVVRPLLARLERDLGVVEVHKKSVFNVFASAPGAGAVAHFDPEINFAVQLKGKKRWWISDNTQIQFAPSAYSVIDTDATMSPALRIAWGSAPRPKRLPGKPRVIDVDEGSALYFPAGCWHKTKTLEESIHVVLAIWPKSWLGVLSSRLRASFPQRVGGTPVQAARLSERVAERIAALRAEELVDGPRGRRARSGRRPQVQ